MSMKIYLDAYQLDNYWCYEGWRPVEYLNRVFTDPWEAIKHIAENSGSKYGIRTTYAVDIVL